MFVIKPELLILTGVLNRIWREVEGGLGRSCGGRNTRPLARSSWRRLPLVVKSHGYMVLKSYLRLKLLGLLLLCDHCLHQLQMQELSLGGIDRIQHALHARHSSHCDHLCLLHELHLLLLLLKPRGTAIKRGRHRSRIAHASERAHIILRIIERTGLMVCGSKPWGLKGPSEGCSLWHGWAGRSSNSARAKA